MAPVVAAFSGSLLVIGLIAVEAGQPMPIMMTVGCIESDGRGGFILTRAAEPQALSERMPAVPAADVPLGTKTLKLIGTLDEFGISSHEGKKVWAKGLLNAGDPLDLLNLTSITQLTAACD